MALPCPNCRHPLGLDLNFIIMNPVCVCPNCDLIMDFTINQEIKNKFQETLQEIEDIKKKYSNIAKFN